MSLPVSPPKQIQQLRWKLTLSYTAVTIVALLTVEFLILSAFGTGLIVFISSGRIQTELIKAASVDLIPLIRPYLIHIPPDREGLESTLKRFSALSSISLPLTFDATDQMFVVARNGTLLAVHPLHLIGEGMIGNAFDPSSISGLQAPLQSALAGESDIRQLYTRAQPGEAVIITVPVWDEQNQHVLGVLIGIGQVPTWKDLLADIIPILLISVIVFTLIAGLAGTSYGFLAARNPVRRINRLARASLAWSEGDFSIIVDDDSNDELGRLSHYLNQMAQQLKILIETRRELIIIEERNRIARELHDSAKQQAFAAAAQLDAAKSLINQNPEAAEYHLKEAELLTLELRHELTALIKQLRPAILEDRGLSPTVQAYASSWSRQTEIAVEVRAQGERALPLDIEQAVFRIIQEALSNIQRHSKATNVEIDMVYTSDDFTCSIRDDGIGFDPKIKYKGLGLQSMEERSDAVEGNLNVQSIMGKGTVIMINIPISNPSGNHEVGSNE